MNASKTTRDEWRDCGTVCRAVAIKTRGSGFEINIWQFLYGTLFTVDFLKNKKRGQE